APAKAKVHRQPAEQYRLQRDVVDEVGRLGAVEADDLPQRAQMADEPVAAPPPGERAQRKPLAADLLAMCALPRRDDDLEPGIAGRPRDRQAVRAEIPILGDEKEQLGSGHAADVNQGRLRLASTIKRSGVRLKPSSSPVFAASCRSRAASPGVWRCRSCGG